MPAVFHRRDTAKIFGRDAGVYERNRLEPLRDLLVWTDERSCQQYAALKQNMVMPDLFRLKQREPLAHVVAARVCGLQAPKLTAIRDATPASAEKAERERFGLRTLEFDAWAAVDTNMPTT